MIEKSIILKITLRTQLGLRSQLSFNLLGQLFQAGGGTFQSDMVRLKRANNGVCGQSLYTGAEHVLYLLVKSKQTFARFFAVIYVLSSIIEKT